MTVEERAGALFQSVMHAYGHAHLGLREDIVNALRAAVQEALEEEREDWIALLDHQRHQRIQRAQAQGKAS